MWNIDATMEKKTLDAPPKKPKNNKMNNIEKNSTEAAHYHIWVARIDVTPNWKPHVILL